MVYPQQLLHSWSLNSTKRRSLLDMDQDLSPLLLRKDQPKRLTKLSYTSKRLGFVLDI